MHVRHNLCGSTFSWTVTLAAVTLQVSELRKLVAKQLQLPADRLRLVHKGATLWDGRDAPTLTDAGAEHNANERPGSGFAVLVGVTLYCRALTGSRTSALCCASAAMLHLSLQIRC
jgi:hypothetical protein